jgi:hypothetical protein
MFHLDLNRSHWQSHSATIRRPLFPRWRRVAPTGRDDGDGVSVVVQNEPDAHAL